MSAPLITGHGDSTKSYFDFWFIEIYDTKTQVILIQLMASCPVCDTSYVIRPNIKNIALMREALKCNGKYYIDLVKKHCPNCFPGNPIKQGMTL